MEQSGIIIAVLPLRTGISQKTGKQWMTQQYVLETTGQYPRHMVFEVFGEDRIRQFNIQPQGQYNVSFDIDASEYQGKWYNQVRAHSVVLLAQPASSSATPVQSAVVSQQSQHAKSTLFPPEQNSYDDNLPF